MGLRQELETELGRALPGGVWDLLVEDRYVSEYEQADSDQLRKSVWKELIARCKQLIRLGIAAEPSVRDRAPGRTQAIQRGRSTAYRDEAVAALLAANARTFPDVRSFRHEVLHDRLLVAEELPAWITEQAKTDGPRTVLDSSWPGELAPCLHLRHSDIKLGAVVEVPINVNGTLGRLKELADLLCRRSGWQEHRAVDFVLTDAVPAVDGRVEVDLISAGIMRIKLDFPSWCDASDVLHLFREALEQSPLDFFRKRTPRPISERISRLVVFVCEDRVSECGVNWL